jgi:hypothetical protein
MFAFSSARTDSIVWALGEMRGREREREGERERERGRRRGRGRERKGKQDYIGGESNQTRNTRQYIYVSELRYEACIKYNHHLNYKLYMYIPLPAYIGLLLADPSVHERIFKRVL